MSQRGRASRPGRNTWADVLYYSEVQCAYLLVKWNVIVRVGALYLVCTPDLRLMERKQGRFGERNEVAPHWRVKAAREYARLIESLSQARPGKDHRLRRLACFA